MQTKVFLLLCTMVVGQCVAPNKPKESNGEIAVTSKVIYPKFRIHTTPRGGEEAPFNSPSLEWPTGRRTTYDLRLSYQSDFSGNQIIKKDIPFAIFNPHQKLEQGIWFWQYREQGKDWNPVDSFIITASTQEFVTPGLDQIANRLTPNHPRVFAKKSDLATLRKRAGDYKETMAILHEADQLLNEIPPAEVSALPRHQGANKYEDSKIAQQASKQLGWQVLSTLNLFSQAYLLTGSPKYFMAAKKWMVEVSNWDPLGITHRSNFGDAGIMTSLALAIDTFWDLLSEKERNIMIAQAATRANNFYNLWVGKVESRSSSMHVWQHILHQLFQTSLALWGETPDAEKWLEYCYEIWIAQFPKMGEEDGAWFNGIGYFIMNALTIYDMSASLRDITGVDFQWSPWFQNNPKWLTYAFPPNSVGDGFCNDGDKYWYPTMKYAGFMNAAARMFNNSQANWYANEVAGSLNKEIADEAEFRWFRIQRAYKHSLPGTVTLHNMPQAAHFPEIGVSYMHTSIHDISNNLMLSAICSPFGSNGHKHAEQNNFNIAFGGKRLFYNSGYRPNMSDPHHQAWHKHTRGHNTILIDGKGQPFDAGAYGWMPRFLHGEQISYVVGDASNAYSAHDLDTIDLGLDRFRRHYFMLRPSTIVIYDELEADHAADWTWLLHHDKEMVVNPRKRTISAENEAANALVTLHSSTDLAFNITDTFSVPARNWNRKTDQEGNLIDFVNQWHFSGSTQAKNSKMRFLAIIQVKSKRGNTKCQDVLYDQHTQTHSVLGWNISAEMDPAKPAKIKIDSDQGMASFVSSGALKFNRSIFEGNIVGSSKLVEVINGETFFQEVIDTIPSAIQKSF